MAGQQAQGRRLISARRTSYGLVGPFLQDLDHRLAFDSLARKLATQDVFAARMGTVSRLDPGTGKGKIVEHFKFNEPRDRLLDEE